MTSRLWVLMLVMWHEVLSGANNIEGIGIIANHLIGINDQGVVLAQFSLGVMYRDGQGVFQVYKKAAQWLLKAANQGHVDAQFSLGDMYRNGQGVSQDHKEAARWYRKAADKGHLHAQSILGFVYLISKYLKNCEQVFLSTLFNMPLLSTILLGLNLLLVEFFCVCCWLRKQQFRSMRCPISQKSMADPVFAPDGQSYERSAIEQWFSSGKNTSPATGATLLDQNLVPAFALRRAIHGAFPEARERFEAILEVSI